MPIVLRDIPELSPNLQACFIRLASPSWMGHVNKYDIYNDDSPGLTLLEAMKLSAERDMIAQQYTNNF